MENNLVIAVPSKGRLQEKALAFFARSGLGILRPGGDRNYRGLVKGLDNAEIAFLSASEIARELKSGTVHFGITGEDLIRETIEHADDHVDLSVPLGFGHADVVVAVPNAWIDVRTIDDLGDVAIDMRVRHGRRMRIATKYVNLTRNFFAAKGILDYRIVESLGATEGAPAAGSADIIVDITSTGSTLHANNLKIPEDGVILRSQANLVASLHADWDENALNAAAELYDRIQAEERARSIREVRTRSADAVPLVREAMDKFAATTPYGIDGCDVVLHVPEQRVYALSRWLRTQGAAPIGVSTLDYVFAAENPLFDALVARLKS